MICISFFIIAPLHSMNEETQINYNPQGLLIFLDETEQVIDAVSHYLLSAIRQKAGPIVVSASLLKNVFGYYNELKNYPESSFDLYQKINVGSLQEIEEKSKIFYLKTLNFDSNEWIFKKVNDSLYLLIPKLFLQKIVNLPNDVIERYDPNNISRAEMTLGLKVNHMETTPFDKIVTMNVIKRDNSNYFFEALYDTNTNKSSLFCTKSDYKNRGVQNIPLWSIFMQGHGAMQYDPRAEGIIVGLTHTIFKKVLDFFENSINTRLLVYISCYAAGSTNELIFKDVLSGVQKTYSFAIITQALTDAPVMSASNILLSSDGKVVVGTLANFESFLLLARTLDFVDYKEIIKTIFPLMPSEDFKNQNKQLWAHIPQLKLPGVEWFSVLESNKNVLSIGSILAKTRNVQTPLDVVRFFKADPKALLLYAPEIPFELIYTGKNLEAIVSMIPGNAIHHLKKISSSTKNEQELLQSFMAIDMLGPRKIFFIEELNDMKNVIIYNLNEPTKRYLTRYSYQLSYPGTNYNFAMYEKDKVLYVKRANQVGIKVQNESFKKGYVNLLAEARAFKDSPLTLLSRENFENMSALLQNAHEKRKQAKIIKKQQKSQKLPIALRELQKKLAELFAQLSS